MLKKLSLDQTKKYERCLAVEVISKMLLDFISGRPYYLAIGAEQGNIDKWDDFVIRKNDGGNIYIQVKRQTTPFSTDSVIRDKNTKGALKELSTIDESLKSLGERIKADKTGLNDLKNEFWIELPESSVLIKEELEIRKFRNLCEVQVKSVTTPDDLSRLALISKDTNNIYNWLTTWCEFTDWDHILKALRVLKTKTSGMEVDINNRVNNNLMQIFNIADIDQVHQLIESYLNENETYAGEIKPRQLLHHLKNYLRPNIRRWTSFKVSDSSWHISGVHDLEDNNCIERASVIVPALWSNVNANTRILKIDGVCGENCYVSESLMRVTLHPYGSFDIYCSDRTSWNNSIRYKTGGTLGITKDDIDNLRILNDPETSQHSEIRVLSTIDEKEKHAEELHNEMNKITLQLVHNKISNKLQDMKKGDLRTEVEKRWMLWKQALEDKTEEQRKLFSTILHPKAEGESIRAELRVGPKTAELLSEAIFLLLVVSVCLGDDSNNSWGSVRNKLLMNSIGLAFWSGPAEGDKKVIEIDDDVGICKLLQREPGQILIISQSELTEAEAFKDDIYGNITKLELLTHPSYPKLLITNERAFKRELAKGDISSLRDYFQRILERYERTIESAINKVVDEVVL